MKPNTKYVAKDGYQIAMYPNPVMNITQSINGSFSHRGTNAIDDAQENSGISQGYAPCDMKCVATDYKPGNGNAIWWESINKVHTLKYGLTKIYMMVLHDNTANAYVGMTVKQGEQLFEEGTAGRATGNHSHVEFGVGNFKGQYVLNNYGVWMMPGNLDPSDILFADDTRIINGGGLIWEKIPESLKKTAAKPKPEISLTKEHRIAVVGKGHNINIRKGSPTGTIVRTVKEGTKVEYTEKCVTNGHRYVSWLEGKDRMYMAVSADETKNNMWVSITDVNAKPAEDTKPSTAKKELIGVDISAYQTGINYNELAKHIDFAILRAGYGTVEDTMVRKHYKGLKDAGVSVTGLYVFDYALNDAQAVDEAKFMVKLAKDLGLPKTAVLWFDCEYDSVSYAGNAGRNGVGTINKDRSMIQRHTRLFMDEVDKSGYKTGYYANLDWMRNKYNGFQRKSGEQFWYARYDYPNPEYEYDVLQYTSGGKVAGYNGSLDMNKIIVKQTTNVKEEKYPLTKEDGVFICGDHTINVRVDDPVDGKIIRTMKNHNAVRYTEKCVSEKHRHVSWFEDGKRLYVAINDSPEQGKAMWGEIITHTFLPDFQNKKYFYPEDRGGENPYPIGICTWLSYGCFYQATGKKPVFGWEPSKSYTEKDWAFQLVDKLAARDKNYVATTKPTPMTIASTRADEGGSHTFFVTDVHSDGTFDYWEANMNNSSEANPWEADIYYRRNATVNSATHGYYLKFAAKKPTVKWNQDATLKVGDTVKSVSCHIAASPATGTAIYNGEVYVPALGGFVPLEDVTEASDTGDGKLDDHIANIDSKVYLNECKVEAINGSLNLVKINGYWVNAEPLMKKE